MAVSKTYCRRQVLSSALILTANIFCKLSDILDSHDGIPNIYKIGI